MRPQPLPDDTHNTFVTGTGPRTPWREFATVAGLIVIAVVLQLPLLGNPGYFSHDDLRIDANGALVPAAPAR